MTRDELTAKLEDIENAIDSVLSTGQSYTLTNSMVVTAADIDKLDGMARQYRKRLSRSLGYTGRHYASFE